MQVRVGLTVLLLTGCCSQTEPPPVQSPWEGRLDLEALTAEILGQLERRGLEAIEPPPRELEGRLIELDGRRRVDFELGWLASEGAWWRWVPPRILADLIQAGAPGLDWEESQLMVRSSLLRVVGDFEAIRAVARVLRALRKLLAEGWTPSQMVAFPLQSRGTGNG